MSSNQRVLFLKEVNGGLEWFKDGNEKTDGKYEGEIVDGVATTDGIYPSIGEQLDYIYHNGIDKWKTDIVDPVKAKYPKP